LTLLNASKDEFFNSFEVSVDGYPLPSAFTLISNNDPHPLCVLAAGQLQRYLQTQKEWSHNFGLKEGDRGTVIGKMFGVLVVRTTENRIGYLAAFSGKMAGGNHHSKFVPPVFDSLTDNGFLNNGMAELTRLTKDIKELEKLNPDVHQQQISILKERRKKHSISLQHKLFDNYYFLNQNGDKKSLYDIFKDASYKNPPAGAGECAGPKLLQYAFQHRMTPLSLAEFWWGQSPKSDLWKHGEYYACCREKCEPILAHMLAGMI
jgi:tRNA pseudouridine32 synthase/23S rRNA pseudouridine746 synthase